MLYFLKLLADIDYEKSEKKEKKNDRKRKKYRI